MNIYTNGSRAPGASHGYVFHRAKTHAARLNERQRFSWMLDSLYEKSSNDPPSSIYLKSIRQRSPLQRPARRLPPLNRPQIDRLAFTKRPAREIARRTERNSSSIVGVAEKGEGRKRNRQSAPTAKRKEREENWMAKKSERACVREKAVSKRENERGSLYS